MVTVLFITRSGKNAIFIDFTNRYCFSHENYQVISLLLDTKVKLDETNKAGYSPIMLAALCTIKDETESMIIQRLFERGNVGF
jgi:hypothetical protein